MLGLEGRNDMFADIVSLLAGVDADRDRSFRGAATAPDDQWRGERGRAVQQGTAPDLCAQSLFSFDYF